jgi:Fe2+ transport system protein B
LWATFGIDQITSYDENFSRDEMKRWKISDCVKKAHDDLYSPVSSNSESSETYLSLIFKRVFVSEEEQTKKNAIWYQAILEIIFDESSLSSKIDNDTIDKWYSKLIKVFILYIILLLFCWFYQFH